MDNYKYCIKIFLFAIILIFQFYKNSFAISPPEKLYIKDIKIGNGQIVSNEKGTILKVFYQMSHFYSILLRLKIHIQNQNYPKKILVENYYAHQMKREY